MVKSSFDEFGPSSVESKSRQGCRVVERFTRFEGVQVLVKCTWPAGFRFVTPVFLASVEKHARDDLAGAGRRDFSRS